MAVLGLKYNEKKRTITGTVNDDLIDASELDYVAPAEGKNKNKGLTIKGGTGNDTITGTEYNDKIIGGKGENRIIYDVAEGADGKMANPIGHDVINLTKGETLHLDFVVNGYDIDTYALKFKQGEGKNGKNDLVIYMDGDEDNSVTVKNYYGKNTGAAVFIGDYYDLRYNARFEKVINDGDKSNYKGSFLADKIDASALTVPTKTKKGVEYGVSVNGGAGSDIITGSDYIDVLKAGTTGYDTITGGAGDDKLYAGTSAENMTTFNFNTGDGNDTIYSGKGRDILNFTRGDLKFVNGTGKNKRDLIIFYNHDEEGNAQDSVTIKNYYNKKGEAVSSVKDVRINGNWFELEELRELAVNGVICNNTLTLSGTSDDDIIIAQNGVQIIQAGAGNDTIYGSSSTNLYELNSGNNTVYVRYNSQNPNLMNVKIGSGNDTIYCANGGDKATVININGEDVGNKGDNTVYYGGSYIHIVANEGPIRDRFDDIIVAKKSGTEDFVFKYENTSITIKNYYYYLNKDNYINNWNMFNVRYYNNEGVEIFGAIYSLIRAKDGEMNLIEGSEETVDGTSDKDYIIAKNPDVLTINGGSGDDIYEVSFDESRTITDTEGNDKLLLSANKSNISLSFNVNQDGTFADGDDKLILTSDEKSIVINDFDSIETIKSMDGYYLDTTKLNALKSDVVSWLTSANGGVGYTDVATALASEDADLSTLVAMFERDSNWQVVS